MKTVKKNVYYCEFCKKKSLSASVIHKHETYCTGNPDRLCRCCDRFENINDLKELIALIPSDDKLFNSVDEFGWQQPNEKIISEVLKQLRDKSDNCPACILAAIKQSKTTVIFQDFNFKEEMIKFFRDTEPEINTYY
jgi:hypothetical protein